MPFTGVVGATARAAVDATRNRKIGIIGTAATVRSGSYAAIIRDMMPDVQIFARACPMFVPLVENGYFNDGNPVTKLIIAEYLQELKAQAVDVPRYQFHRGSFPAVRSRRRFLTVFPHFTRFSPGNQLALFGEKEYSKIKMIRGVSWGRKAESGI